jgi:hypothetical protein
MDTKVLEYRNQLMAAGLLVTREYLDEGGYYFEASKTAAARPA